MTREDNADSLRQIDKLKLGDAIASGAYGSVWKVNNVVFKDKKKDDEKRELCLKMIGTNLEFGIGSPIEIDILCRLRHPNLMHCIAFKGVNPPTSKKESTLGLLMPLCVSQIFTFCRTYHPSVQTKLKLFLDIAQGLQFLHSSGILHLDIKPDNVLIEVDYASNSISGSKKGVIADFGLSVYHNGSGVKHLSNLVVTEQYKAPEIKKSGIITYTTGTDVWALGCVFFYSFADSKSLLSLPNDIQSKLVGEPKRFDFMLSMVSNIVNGYKDSSNSPLRHGSKPQNPITTTEIDIARLLTGMLDPNPRTRFNVMEIVRCLEVLNKPNDESSEPITNNFINSPINHLLTSYTSGNIGHIKFGSYFPDYPISVTWYLVFDAIIRLTIKVEASVEIFFLACDMFHRVYPLFPDAKDYGDLALLSSTCFWIATKSIGEPFVKSSVIVDIMKMIKVSLDIQDAPQSISKHYQGNQSESLVRMERAIIEVIDGLIYQPNLYSYCRHSFNELTNAFETLRHPSIYYKALSNQVQLNSSTTLKHTRNNLDIDQTPFANYYSNTTYYKYMRTCAGGNVLSHLTKLFTLDSSK